MLALKVGCEIRWPTAVKTQKAGIFETIDCNILAHGPVLSLCLSFAKFTSAINPLLSLSIASFSDTCQTPTSTQPTFSTEQSISPLRFKLEEMQSFSLSSLNESLSFW